MHWIWKFLCVRSFVNDVDSEAENYDTDKKRINLEFLGGAGESDCDEQDETEGDLTVKRAAKNIASCIATQCDT